MVSLQGRSHKKKIISEAVLVVCYFYLECLTLQLEKTNKQRETKTNE